MAQCAQHRAHQRGLARTQIALQMNLQPGPQADRQRRTERLSGRFVRQRQLEGVRACGRAAIIAAMNGIGHDSNSSASAADWTALAGRIKGWGQEAGFEAVAIAGCDLRHAEPGLAAWLAAGFHGDMDYMARHGALRARPAELQPGCRAAICVRMRYWPQATDPGVVLADGARAYVSRYALGRDYHKVLRARLQKLAERIAAEIPHGYRVFVDSAPLLEVELASSAGLGWRGKHTLTLAREAGSYFFLGEILTDLPLPADPPVSAHCGRCRACIDACPTGAIVAPYRLDARRCISYLTIELKGAIPEELRAPIGNRIYGCDDCQLVCPWNRAAVHAQEPDFAPRHGLDCATLVELFAWSEADFVERMAGSPIYRIGFERWLRNLAVALGNAPASAEVEAALAARANDSSALVREHVAWAQQQQAQRRARHR